MSRLEAEHARRGLRSGAAGQADGPARGGDSAVGSQCSAWDCPSRAVAVVAAVSIRGSGWSAAAQSAPTPVADAVWAGCDRRDRYGAGFRVGRGPDCTRARAGTWDRAARARALRPPAPPTGAAAPRAAL